MISVGVPHSLAFDLVQEASDLDVRAAAGEETVDVVRVARVLGVFAGLLKYVVAAAIAASTAAVDEAPFSLFNTAAMYWCASW
jgi:hypothetical protein